MGVGVHYQELFIKYSRSNLMIFVDYEFNGILIDPQKSRSRSFFFFLRIFKGKKEIGFSLRKIGFT